MTKDQINWIKKLVDFDSSLEQNLKNSSTIFLDKKDNKYIINFKITNFSNYLVFEILNNLYKKINKNFIISFKTNTNNLISLKNAVCKILNIEDSNDIEIYKKDDKYFINCLNLEIYNRVNKKENLELLVVLGIVHDDLFKFSKYDSNISASQVSSFKNLEIKNDNPLAKLNNIVENKNLVLSDIDSKKIDNKKFIVEGEIFEVVEDFYSKSNVRSFKILITDYINALTLKCTFTNRNKSTIKNLSPEYLRTFKKGMWVKADITLLEDSFEHGDKVGSINKIINISKPVEYLDTDLSQNKRIEFNMHTNMSAFDGLNTPEQIIASLKEKGMNTISINDFNSVQSFPSIYKLAKKENINLIYGAEFTLVYPLDTIYNPTNDGFKDRRLVFFDLETTGLSPNYDSIIEFGAYITDMHQNHLQTIQSFIYTDVKIEDKITKITRISANDLKGMPTIKEYLLKLHDIIKPTDILVAHNGINFDIKFINSWCRKLNIPEFTNSMIDTLLLSRAFLKDLSYHSLGRISRFFDLEYDETTAHRADVDSIYLNNIFWKIMEYIPDWENKTLAEINNLSKIQTSLYKRSFFNRIILQSKFKEYNGVSSIKKLYELISISLTTQYNDRPLINLETLNKFKDWFLFSNSAVDGDLFEIGLKESDEYIINWMQAFDYIQIAPISAYNHLVPIYGKNTVIENLKHLLKLAKDNNIKVVAVSNAYYAHKYSIFFHRIYILTKSLGGKRHRYLSLKEDPLNTYTPDLHIRNTKEMIDEMLLLDNDITYINKIVIDNPNELFNSIDHDLIPVQSGLYPPKIEGVEEKLKDNVFKNARLKYGEKLPKFIEDRINFELNIIIKNGYSVVYWISHLLVTKSIEDGFLVGSRGSVGSSLVATFLNITEINPLQAHYYCKNCHYFELIKNNQDSGYDLPEKKCPNCSEILIGEGQNIPFATFLGFDGDKIPDIDLNFSGLYQNNAHNFIKNMFGEKNAFRAGTIGTVAEKTAYAYVKEFLSQINYEEHYSNALMRWWVLNCINVKRTTGQHPGGIVIIPQDKSIYDFTPFNFPADDINLDWHTTHFAFEDIHDNILKFDILGHDDPTILKYLKDLTDVDPRTIPTHDEKVISLFSNISSLNIKDKSFSYKEKNAAIGLPEFGTKFVREMLNETSPKTFSDLIRISGLSHGTDVWANNAQKLVKEGKKLTELVTCRDDIMTNLSSLGIEPLKAFKIMEGIRKGKGLTPEDERLLLEKGIPKWYIDSCKKIVYLFPKAHAAAYVLTAWRIAWFKVYYPLEYYSTYFTVRCEVFDIDTMRKGSLEIFNRLRDIQARRADKKLSIDVTKKEIDLISVLEVALEMSLRGYKITNINLNKSDANKFIIDHDNKALIPPFKVIDGLGEAVSRSIIEARKIHKFVSIEDFKQRTKVNKTQIKNLEELGVFEGLNESNQLTFNF